MSKGKLKLAALGGAAICCLALLGVLFMPTHASADRDSAAQYRLDLGGAYGNPYASNQDQYSDQNLLRRINWRAFGVEPCISELGSCDDPQRVSDTQYFEPQFRVLSGERSRESGENQQNGQGIFAGNASRQFGAGSPIGFFLPGPSNNAGNNSGNNTGDNADVTGPSIETPDLSVNKDVPFDLGAPPFVEDPTKPAEFIPSPDLVHELPEPLSVLLFAVGLTGMAVIRRRSGVRIIRA